MSQRIHGEIRLEPFERRWAATVLGWITSPEELFHWTARTDFPLTDAMIFDEWHSDHEITPYVLLIDDDPRAYGEVWFEEGEPSAELGRLIVSPKHRRRSCGTLLIERLISTIRATECREVWVRLFPTNLAALGCYEAADFARVFGEQETALNADQRFSFVWMIRRI